MCCHSEQGLGLIPNRPESGEFNDHLIDSPRNDKVQARIAADVAAADKADLKGCILSMVDLKGPTDAREVRLLAAERIREMQRSRGLRLDMAGQLRWFRRFRDLIAEIFLPAPQAAMIRATLTTSEMQGLDLDAPRPEQPDGPECQSCAGVHMEKVGAMEYDRGDSIGSTYKTKPCWICPSCGNDREIDPPASADW